MSSILEQLAEWGEGIPQWQQVAFEKILIGQEIAEPDYDQLFQLFLEESKLTKKKRPWPKVLFPRSSLLAFPKTKPILQKLTGLKNINALVSGQVLTFDPKLTVIFGANGSGKSGYARLLACGAFTRGDKEILPEIGPDHSAVDVQGAEIEIYDGEKTQILSFHIGKDPVIGSFYAFDTTSVRKQLTEQNSYSFCPANLDSLTSLAECIETIQKKFKSKVEECKQKVGDLFPDDSPVLSSFFALGSDLGKVREIKKNLDKEEHEIKVLDLEIATLKTQSLESQIQKLKRSSDDLKSFRTRLRAVEDLLNEKNWDLVNQAIEDYTSALQKAERRSHEKFGLENFSGIGSPEWNGFIKAAHDLAKLESRDVKEYPVENDHCLFCQQELSPAARELINRYWKFLEAEDEKNLESARMEINLHRKRLTDLNVEFCLDGTSAYRVLEVEDPALLEQLVGYLDGAKKNIAAAVSSMIKLNELEWSECLSYGAPLEILIESLGNRIHDLESKNAASEIQRLERRKAELVERKLVSDHVSQLTEWFEKTEWIKKAEAVKINTRHITAKYNELFEHLVSDRYIEQFDESLKELGRTLNVKVVTRGKKGESVKQLCLTAETKISPDRVLSEGEKRAVVLADFLTEVTLDENSSGIILDDPVTSLDWEWKHLIAERIVKEAKKRQVIVFTHDLHFLYLMRNLAEESGISPATHWIRRGQIDDRPGYVFLNSCPSLEEEYKDTKRARDFYSRANKPDLDPEEQERLLRDGFGALRTTYEAFVIFELFGGVVRRFEERISIERLKEVVIKPELVQQVIEKVGLLSRYIEGHLHSDINASQKPEPKLLLQEIEAFEKLRSQQKDLKKGVQRSSDVSVQKSQRVSAK